MYRMGAANRTIDGRPKGATDNTRPPTGWVVAAEACCVESEVPSFTCCFISTGCWCMMVQIAHERFGAGCKKDNNIYSSSTDRMGVSKAVLRGGADDRTNEAGVLVAGCVGPEKLRPFLVVVSPEYLSPTNDFRLAVK